MTALGVLCCFALFVCLILLASFFLPSHLSFKNMYMYSICMYLDMPGVGGLEEVFVVRLQSEGEVGAVHYVPPVAPSRHPLPTLHIYTCYIYTHLHAHTFTLHIYTCYIYTHSITTCTPAVLPVLIVYGLYTTSNPIEVIIQEIVIAPV